MGPATRDGCGQVCIDINMPCRGCFGPVLGVTDAGTKYISALASMIDAEDEDEINALVDKLADPAGYLYRFTLPSSTLQEKQRK